MQVNGKSIVKMLGAKSLKEFVISVLDPLKNHNDIDVIDSWENLLVRRLSALMAGKKEAYAHSTFVVWAEKIHSKPIYEQMIKNISKYQTAKEEQRLSFINVFNELKKEEFMPIKMSEKIERKFKNNEDSEAVLLMFLCALFRKDITLLSFLYIDDEKDDVRRHLSDSILNDRSVSFSVKNRILLNTNFFGYKEELKQAIEYLEEYHILFVYGIGGIGKTKLVRKIVQEQQHQYESIVFLTFENSICQMLINDNFLVDGINRQYNSEGKPESDEEYSMRKLKHFIQHTDDKTLVIVDNFDTQYDPMLKELISGSYSLIITTRCNWSHLDVPILHLTGLDEKAQYELFVRYYKRQMSKDESTNQLSALLQLTLGHPLAIELVANLMFHKGISISEMTNILSTKGITPELSGNISHGFGKAESIYNNIQKVFSIESLNNEEKQVLIDMTLLPVKGVAPEQFADLSGQNNLEIIMQLYDRSWILYNESTNVISLHPLISDVITGEIRPSLDSTEFFLRRYTEIIQNTWEMLLSDKQLYTDIGLRILQRFPDVDADYLSLYRNIAILIMRMDYFDISNRLLKECLDCTKQEYGELSKQTAENYYCIADHLLYNGELIKSLEYINKAIDIMHNIAQFDLRTAYYYKYNAWILLNDPKPDNLPIILNLLDHTEQILSHYPDKDDAAYLDQKASLLTAYAYYYYELKQYEKALDYANEAFPIYQSLFGDISADTAAPLTITALILSKTRKGEEALTIIRNVIQVQKQLFSEQNQKVILRYRSLANIYYNIGDLENAIKTMETVCHGFESKSAYNDFFYLDSKKKLSAWRTEAHDNSK